MAFTLRNSPLMRPMAILRTALNSQSRGFLVLNYYSTSTIHQPSPPNLPQSVQDVIPRRYKPPPRYILANDFKLPIRVRFAPSPTGDLHLGSLRTALFNRLLADSSDTGGTLVLRVEDTDQARFIPGSEESILQDLRWAGLTWEEGPDRGGPYGPYRQSERIDIYKQHVQQLYHNGHVYRCFCTDVHPRTPYQPKVYPGTCRHIEDDESTRRAAAGEPHTWRFKTDLSRQSQFIDAIYGHFEKADADQDIVLIKTDGFPTYHFANVVDDHMMKITHVLRGEEWLISTPKHLALYKAFGWDPPIFCHVGLLANPDGTKMSKRNGDIKLGPYRDQGYLPIPLLCWLANLGSSFHKGVEAIRTIRDITDALTFKFTRGSIQVNKKKLDYFQKQYERSLVAWNQSRNLTQHEALIFENSIKQPILRGLETVVQDGTDNPRLILPPAWKTKLELIPSLESHKARTAYVDHMLAVSPPARLRPFSTFVYKHPYVFWRVPHDIYIDSLATLDSSKLAAHRRILEAISALVYHDEQTYWKRASDWLYHRLGVKSTADATLLHDTVRLVATGSLEPGMNTILLFQFLGRDEWRYRLGVVNKILDTSSSTESHVTSQESHG